MMGIQKLREEFEILPEVASHLHNVVFDIGCSEYLPKKMGYVIHEFSAYFINGAWYSFQEQQKVIDEIKTMAENWINQDYTYNSDSTDIKIQQMKDCGRDIIQKINGE